jgi:hypothetical protein
MKLTNKSKSDNVYQRYLPGMMMLLLLVSSAPAGAADNLNITPAGHFGGFTNTFEVSGNYAYISQGSDFVVLDISNKSAPVETGRLGTSGTIYEIAVVGNYAYVAEGNGLVIVDVSNPAASTLKGTYHTVHPCGC